MNLLLCLIFFLSGAAALLFETLWFHQSGLALGNGVWASSLVLAGFMAGLALGNALVARFGPRLRDPVRTYAVLELLIAGAGLTLVYLLPSLTGILTPLLRPILEQPWIANPIRLVVAFAILLAPSTAMGATLPLLVKALQRRDGHYGSALGRLYGWNTLGAVAGALVGELWFVEMVGIRGSAWIAAAANGVAALGALALSRRFTPAELGDAAPAGARPRLSPRGRSLLFAAFLSGGILLALEVVWFRFLLLFVNGTSLAFSIMLAVVLAGIALGSLTAGAWLRRWPRHHAGAAAVAGVSAALVVSLYAGFARLPFQAVSGLDAGFLIVRGAALMGPVAFLSGWLFTWIGSAFHEQQPEAVRATGLLTLSNTLGSGLGSLVGGFVLLPWLGIEDSLLLLAALYGGVALLCWPPTRARVPFVLATASAALAALVLARFPSGLLERAFIPATTSGLARSTGAEVVEVEEGRTETIVLMRRALLGEPLDYVLLTNGHSMTSTTPVARRYMNFYAYWPRLFMEAPRSGLLISYGLGNTARAILEAPSLERLDVVDLSREILELSPKVYPGARDPLADPRVEVHVDDGRYFLETTERRFDIITGEPPPPKNAGVVNLYTREYFQLVYDRLNEGGIHTYWLPVHNLTHSDTRAILAAYCAVFDDCSLWAGTALDWMLVGSRNAEYAHDEERFRALWSEGAAEELVAVGFERPEQIGATFLADAEQLAQIIGGELPLEDDHPKRLEHHAPGREELTDLYTEWIDTDRARERFRESAFIARAWPPALRDETLPWFDVQRTWNDWTLAYYRFPSWAERMSTIHRLLEETELRALPLIEMGTSLFELEILDGLAEDDQRTALALSKRGQLALVDRRPAEAAELLRQAHTRAPDSTLTLQLRLYALCRAGALDEAASLAQRAVRGRRIPADDPIWPWFEETFGLVRPSA